jgi:hypothetical protein
MQRSASIVSGHRGSIVWYLPRGEGGYFVLQVDFEDRPSVLMEAICTFTPTWGIDSIDGMLIEDAEHLVLSESLGFNTPRLDVYGSALELNPIAYLTARGVTFKHKSDRKKWWQFWR